VTAEISHSRTGAEAAQRIAVVAWGLAGAVACALMALLEPNLVEEGFPLHVAQRLVAGQRLYRDIAFFTGPVPFELLGLLFRIFGESILVARGVVVVLAGMTAAATFDLARRAGTGALAHVAAAAVVVAPALLFPLYSIYFHTTLAMSLAMLAVYAAVRALASAGWACTSGMLAACVALSKQTVGATLGLGLLGALWLMASHERRRGVIAGFLLGSCGVALVNLLAFAAVGTVHDMVTALVVTPFALGNSFRMPFPSLWPPGAFDHETLRSWVSYLPTLYVILVHPPTPFPYWLSLSTQLLYAAPVAVLGATLARGAFQRLPAPVWLNSVGLLAAATNLVPRADWGHLATALPSTAVQLVLLMGAPGAGRASRQSHALAAASLVGALLLAGVVSGLEIYARSGPPTFGPRVPLRPVSDLYRAPAVPRVIEYLRTHTKPGEEIFVARQEPLLYFATGTRNPTRYEGMLQGIPEQQEEAVLDVLPHLRYVVMSELDSPERGVYAQELPAINAALERYFRLPDDFPLDAKQWILVLERGPDRGPTAIDFVAGRMSGRPWMRTRNGELRWMDPAQVPVASSRGLRRPLIAPVSDFGGGIDFSLEVPAHAVFQAALGLGKLMTSEGVVRQGVGVNCYVRVLGAQREEVIASLELPGDPSGDRGWQPIEADLSAYAGQHITLRLEAVPWTSLANPGYVWWGSPRLVVNALGR
jgi:hypothetical protein